MVAEEVLVEEATAEMTGARLSTVRVMTEEVATLELVSLATAVTDIEPLASSVLSTITLYGATVSSDPVPMPLIKNRTPAMAILSEAVALRVTAVPEITVPLVGVVTATAGAVTSGVAVVVNV